ncbi:hypothetical protein HD554DRAFT_2202309 [Boletus coccyginus]|nr:hypothetical protein HD554DRAFT_2202309 [Boletus coccyginus]
MPDASLPEYTAPPSQLLSPTYTALPRTHEYRLAFNPRLRPNRSPRSFIKQTKSGNVSLRLVDQDDRVAFPVYGLGASTEGITGVEVQVEGILKLEEVAEDGTSTHRLFTNKSMLWIKDRIQDAPCPNSLRFSFPLPTTYPDGDLHISHLSGLPGFRAHVRYSVSAVVVRPNDVSNMVKSTLFRKDDWTVSTPFSYLPCTRPPVPIPVPLEVTAPNSGFVETPQWKSDTRSGSQGPFISHLSPNRNIPIPFHVSFHSDTDSLRAFLPLAPVAGLIAPKKQATRIQLMRQITVDVRNAIVLGTKTDIWRVGCIGEGAFRNAGTGTDWAAFSGDIFISDEVTVGGSELDYLVLTTTPPDFSKSPFKELRMVVPIRLVTDCWNSDVYLPPSAR